MIAPYRKEREPIAAVNRSLLDTGNCDSCQLRERVSHLFRVL
jgi:hypothetical protein